MWAVLGFLRWFWDPVVGMLPVVALPARVCRLSSLPADDQWIAVLVCEVLDFKTCVFRPLGYCLRMGLKTLLDVCLFLSMKSLTILIKKEYDMRVGCKRLTD